MSRATLEDEALFGRRVLALAARGRLVLEHCEGSQSRCEYVAEDRRHPKLAEGDGVEGAVEAAMRQLGRL